MRRAVLWATLVALLLVAQTLLVLLTLNYETSARAGAGRRRAGEAAAQVRRDLALILQSLQALTRNEGGDDRWHGDATQLLRARRELLRIERRDAPTGDRRRGRIAATAPARSALPRAQMSLRNRAGLRATRGAPARRRISRSYFVPQPGDVGAGGGRRVRARAPSGVSGFTVATMSLPAAARRGGRRRAARASHELSFTEGDGTRLARAGVPRGSGVYVAQRLVDLPGNTLLLRVDSAGGGPDG